MSEERLRAFRRAAPWLIVAGLAALSALGALVWHAPPGRQPDRAIASYLQLPRDSLRYAWGASVSRWGREENVVGQSLLLGGMAWVWLGRWRLACVPLAGAVVAGLGELVVK